MPELHSPSIPTPFILHRPFLCGSFNMADQKPINRHQLDEIMSHLEDIKSGNRVILYRIYSLSEAAAIEERFQRDADFIDVRRLTEEEMKALNNRFRSVI